MTKTLILVFFSLVLSVSERARAEAVKRDLTCRQIDGLWKVYNIKSKSLIGVNAIGEADQQRCLEFIDSLTANAVCIQQEKDSYRPYNAEAGHQIGKSGSKGFERCKEYLATAREDLMCVYSSETEAFRVNRITNGTEVTDTGSKSLERCADYVKTANADLVCIYTANESFKVFRKDNGLVMGNGSYAGSLERCHDYIKSEKNGLLCHYDGADGAKKKFRAYKLKNNEPFGFPNGTYAESLELCQKQIDDFEVSSFFAVPRDISVQVKQVKDLLVREFAPFVKTLSRPVSFYNYYGRSELGVAADVPVNLFSPIIAESIENWRSSFDQHIPFESGWLGYGLYGAANPVDSQKYADPDWILSEISVPQGANFLELRLNDKASEYNYSLHLSDRAKTRLSQLCRIKASDFKRTSFDLAGADYSWSINKVALGRNRICHEGLSEALKALDVQFISYNWYYVNESSIRSTNVGCDNDRAPAILFVRTNLDKEHLKSFVKSGDDRYVDEYRRIYQLAKLKSQNPVASWPNYKDPNAAKIDVAQELDHQFGCKSQFLEDQPLGVSVGI